MAKKDKLIKMSVYDHSKSTFVDNLTTFRVKKLNFDVPNHVETHWHENYLEAELIYSGTGTEVLNGVEEKMQKGMFTLLSYTDFHSIDTDPGIVFYHLNVSYDFIDNDLKNMIIEHSNIRCVMNDDDFEYTKMLYEKLIEYSHLPETPANQLIQKNLISLIIAQGLTQSAEKNSSIFEQPKTIQKIIQYINKNINQELTLEHIASHFGTSANYLGKLFKKHIGMSFNDYLNRIRLKYACTLIAYSAIPLKEIAHDCGFSSLEYFYYVFKKYYGITPSKYKELNSQSK